MERKLFELKNVEYRYLGKFPGLSDINLKVNAGERIVILGANGSGKSTLLYILAGLIYPLQGVAEAFGRILDKDTFDDEDFRGFFRSRVSLLFQNPEVQLFSPTVEEELYFGPQQLDLPLKKIEDEIKKLSNLLGIENILQRAPHQLSMGEKKKVAIASILAINPEVLLLDEPTAGLDPRTSRELIDLIIEYHKLGKTVITATQDLHIVPEIADKIYILDENKTIACSGDWKDILSNQQLLMKYNLLHIHKHRHQDAWHTHPHEHNDKGEHPD
jgi:cobalt/nickel transport system ATP-binding protein